MAKKYIQLFLLGYLAIVKSEITKQPVFTMCVPEVYWNDCIKMMDESIVKGIPISCVSGRDRYDCIEKVGRKEADIVAVDPEDMYLAAKNNFAEEAGYSIIEQIRTKEEVDEPYRYEAVAVVHKDLEIYDVHGLYGLKSCHTGIGRNVGYKIPITKLKAMGVLGDINNSEYSARENEIRALSNVFKKGCLVGTWSPDPTINQRLKETYSNMCALCEKPEVCDYPDKYSGYEGALRCLTQNGGDIAWTKVLYVKRYFGLPIGKTTVSPSVEKASDYMYFCPDGTKVPIDATTKPCTWAARPWQGYMANGQVKDVDAVQKELSELGVIGEKEKSNWWKNLLLLDDKTLAVKTVPIKPEEHLIEAQYLDVIERNSGTPERDARWCVWNEKSLEKCRALAKASFSRDARPQLDCIQEQDQEACLIALRDDAVDLIMIDGADVKKAIEEYNVKPIVVESYGIGQTQYHEIPAVAVVKKNSMITNLGDLKGKKSCHTYYKNDYAGWIAPIEILQKSNLITSENNIGDLFVSSCAPGAPVGSKLCEQCAGNVASKDESVIIASKCQPTQAEAFSGAKGALKCLAMDKGDVAFVPFTVVEQLVNITDINIKQEDIVLLCPNGGTASINEWEKCNFGLEPPRIFVSSEGKSPNVIEELTHGIIEATHLYSMRPDLLQIYGPWGGQRNILFKDDTTELVAIDGSWNRWDHWATIKETPESFETTTSFTETY
ncbi:hypothetical protein HCN44_006690 [Aphidius gifuensis]|uniref:Transferrin n=1 Tax=Aphidius gifuensis TaxID=684658 RepID=A0A835CVP7_APHGI|nr:transferrin-like [Aphidius gifuensis]KAF7995583.1 hypothetical protein HCN44_006690 [Aphidius gifuensis]